MILLQFIFLLYWKLLCNSTEILQNEGFIISSEEPSLVILSRGDTLSVYTMPAFTVSYSSNNDSGKLTKKKKIVRDKTHFWCSVYESFRIDIAFRLIMPFSLQSMTSSSHLAGFPDNCVNWKVSSVWTLCPFQLCFLAHWAHFPPQSRSKVLMYKKSMFLVLSKIDVKLPTRSTAMRVQSSVSCIFLM